MVHINQAGVGNIETIIPLFAVYRIFYNLESDPAALRDYLYERLTNHQCVIFLAYVDNIAVGFTQLYLGFSSLSLNNSWALNDLCVVPEARGLWVGRKLLDRAKQIAEATWACEIMLQTAADNISAQDLYKKLGYQRDNDFYVYTLELADAS
jgi:ribosomal protein S18 acetylase RimI-like enzyme